MKIPDPHQLAPYVIAAMVLAAVVQIMVLVVG
jgi:hypothetical protein